MAFHLWTSIALMWQSDPTSAAIDKKETSPLVFPRVPVENLLLKVVENMQYPSATLVVDDSRQHHRALKSHPYNLLPSTARIFEQFSYVIMNNTQGSLEALAALCGTQSDAQTEARKRDGSSRASHGNTGSSSSTAQVNQEAAVTTSQQSPLQGLTPQQWQHALAAAAALQQTQSQQANGVNPALAQSLLLPGLPTQGLANSTMEQFALHRYLQQAKVSVAQQAMLAQSLGGFSDPNHALVLALAGKAQQLHWQGNGELTIPGVYLCFYNGAAHLFLRCG